MDDADLERRLVRLKVGDEVFPVSQHILVANSAYFEAIFQPQHSGFREKDSESLTLQELDSSKLKLLIGFLKNSCEETENSELVSSMTPDLLQLCVRLMMKFDYESVAIEALTTQNCHDFLVAAENTASSRLLKAARHKMFVSFSDFRRTRSFKCLPKSELISYLSNTNISYKSEKEVVEAILWWIKYDLNERKKAFKELMFLVEWTKLTQEQLGFLQLLDTVKKCPSFSEIVDSIKIAKLRFKEISLESNQEEINERFAKSLLEKDPRPPQTLVLLVESVLVQKSDKKAIQCFSFYNTEAQAFLDDFVIVEDFPEGCTVAFYEGNLIIFGGIFGIKTSKWNYDIRAYNIFTKKWRNIGRLVKPRRHFELVQNGSQFYLIGGTTTFRLPTPSMDVFDFKKGGTVESCADMLFKMHYPFACCWSGQHLYIFDGSNANSPIYSYDPISNLWMVHLPAVKVLYEKLSVALSCGKYVYLTGYECPVLLRKYVRRLREEKIDKSKTWINDSELIFGSVTILSFFEHDAHIFSFCETSNKHEFVLECFDTKTTNKSKVELPNFYQGLQQLVSSLPIKNLCVQKIVKAKPVNAAWL